MRFRALVFLVFVSTLGAGQDAHFSQFYANPLYLNPALTGTKQCPRFTSSYRSQWATINNAFVTYSAGYDQFVAGMNSGFGITMLYDKAAGGILNSGSVGLTYAYHLQISHELTLSAGLRASFVQKSLNWDEAVWDDMIDPARGFIYQTAQPTGFSANYFDFGSGIFLQSDVFFAGYAVDHLTTPDERLLSTTSNLPMKHTVHIGANVEMNASGRNNHVISPNVLWHQQGEFKQLYFGVYYITDGFTVGGWYRHKDALALLLGYKMDYLQIGYSFDYTISNLQQGPTGAHEVSLSLTFPCNKQNNKNLPPLACPTF